MRILYLDDPVANYGASMLWDGLRKCPDIKVIDFPINPLFHEKSPWSYIENIPEHEFKTEEAVFDIMDSFDVLCLASTRMSNTSKLREWLRRQVPLPPIVLVDQDEESLPRYALIDEFKPICIFHREYLLNRQYPDNCYPLPFSSPFPQKSDFNLDDRPIDVFCAMADNYSSRRWIDWLLTSLGHCHIKYEGFFQRSLPYDEYIQKLQMSKIGIAVRGVGFDTCRYLEVVASHCLLLSDESALVRPNPFLHKKHCVYYHEGNLAWLIQHYLTTPQEMIEIADAGFEHLRKYHTTEARARYFIEKIEMYL